MRGWIGGLVIGIALGSALTSAADVRWWKDITGIVSSNHDFRLGYIEGVNDTMQTLMIVTMTGVSTPAEFVAWVQKEATCLSAHQRTAEEFLQWADAAWQAKSDDPTAQAAGSLMAGACK